MGAGFPIACFSLMAFKKMSHSRIMDLIESGSHETIAEYFHAMFPRDYKWRRAPGWSRRVIDGGKVHWENLEEPHCLMTRVSDLTCELVRKMRESHDWTDAQTREAIAALGDATRVIATLRCMYEAGNHASV